MLSVRLQIAHVGLGVSAGPVQQDQHRLVWIAGAEIPGADSARAEITLRKRNP